MDNQIIIYQSTDGNIKIDVTMSNNSLWLTQAQMAKLFERSISVVSRHIKNIFSEGELPQESNLQNMQIAFFDMAELKAQMHQPMYMKDWLTTLDNFSKDFGIGILTGSGSVSHQQAIDKAHHEYEIYRKQLPEDLTDVEKSYLAMLNDMQNKLKEQEKPPCRKGRTVEKH